jgi:hypothetical protein
VQLGAIAQLLGEHPIEVRVGDRRAPPQRIADASRVLDHRARISTRCSEVTVSSILWNVAALVATTAPIGGGQQSIAMVPEPRCQCRSGHRHGGIIAAHRRMRWAMWWR